MNQQVLVVLATLALLNAGSSMASAQESKPSPKIDGMSVPKLIKSLQSAELRDLAADRLVATGKAAVPHLTRALHEKAGDEPDPHKWKAHVLDVLQRIGKDAVDAAPDLKEAIYELPCQLTPMVLRTLADVGSYAGAKFSIRMARADPAEDPRSVAR